MNRSFVLTLILSFFFLTSVFLIQTREAFSQLFGTAKVEADPNKEYLVSEESGYWFILAKKFSGPNARAKADKLILELRKDHKMNAFLFCFEPDDELEMLALKRNSMRKVRYKYLTPREKEYAVLIGSYPTIEDPGLQKMLNSVKKCKPDCLKDEADTYRMEQNFKRMVNAGQKEYAGFGALGDAIAVPNPTLPEDFFNHKGIVDPFIEKLNSDSRYSLLNNRGLYTVKVATFSGGMAFQKIGEGEKKIDSKLEAAGVQAAALCDELRQQGYTAFEYHDRDASFVTIGEFDQVGTSRPDGMLECNPEIYKIQEKFRATYNERIRSFVPKTVKTSIQGGALGTKKIPVEITLDIQPEIIVVPQREQNFKKMKLAQEQVKAQKENAEQMVKASEKAEYARNYEHRVSASNQLSSGNAQNNLAPYSPAYSPSNQESASALQPYQPQGSDTSKISMSDQGKQNFNPQSGAQQISAQTGHPQLNRQILNSQQLNGQVLNSQVNGQAQNQQFGHNIPVAEQQNQFANQTQNQLGNQTPNQFGNQFENSLGNPPSNQQFANQTTPSTNWQMNNLSGNPQTQTGTQFNAERNDGNLGNHPAMNFENSPYSNAGNLAVSTSVSQENSSSVSAPNSQLSVQEQLAQGQYSAARPSANRQESPNPTAQNQYQQNQYSQNQSINRQTAQYRSNSSSNQTQYLSRSTAQNNGQFSTQNLGQTAQNNRQFSAQNLGQSAQNNRQFSTQNLGQTAQNNRQFSTQNLGQTAQNNRQISAQNLGQTAQNNRQFSTQNLGQTAQNNRQFSAQNLGQTAQNNNGATGTRTSASPSSSTTPVQQAQRPVWNSTSTAPVF